PPPLVAADPPGVAQVALGSDDEGDGDRHHRQATDAQRIVAQYTDRVDYVGEVDHRRGDRRRQADSHQRAGDAGGGAAAATQPVSRVPGSAPLTPGSPAE